jgi:hypothetical protein
VAAQKRLVGECQMVAGRSGPKGVDEPPATTPKAIGAALTQIKLQAGTIC